MLSEKQIDAAIEAYNEYPCPQNGSIGRCIDEGQMRATLEAALRAQADAGPFWHAVVSKSAPVIDKAIRRLDVAEEYADKCRENYPDVTVVPLYTHSSLPAAQGLSDDEITQVWLDHGGSLNGNNFRSFARAILSRAATVAEPSKIEPMRYDALEKAASEARAHIESECEKIGVGKAAQQQAEPESVIKRQAQKIGELIADRDSWIEAHARLYRLYRDQSPRAGEEIHVNVEGGDVYTLPLQLSGMDKPRFVVHVPCSPQAEPGADERAAWDAFLAAKSYPGQWREQSAFYAGYRAAQSGQRSGVAEDANLLRDAAEKGLDINQQPQLGCVEVWAGKGDDALVFREYYSRHADREAATKCALKRALAAPTQQQEGQ
ncbi:hypothetical protein [Ralstonia mannitolilytica]|uniref:Uncharacterized protein n=1 Tax=Ralstonia mannitolilytica TaxID=105219 RepID=A0AAD2EPD2_9RALS|nr:hypothetical protein [Ralstonia mannitolilytica]MBY4721011.1 hypothetical protein [Ralstonia mannitolilytica]CAJ0693051.1 hypothetical protein R77591_04022 [Ralstonia mannitolilytica]